MRRLITLLIRASAGAATVSALIVPASPAAANMLQNPSLEQSSSNGVPTCYTLAGSGSNTYTWTHTTDAHTGTYAEKLSISRWSSGNRTLLSAQDSGTCAPAGQPGLTYTVSAWYKGTGPRLLVYYRSRSGAWTLWSTSATLPGSSAWTQASWTTPALPSGATLVSVGLGLYGTAGIVTMDDFSLNQVPDTTPPTVPTGLQAIPADGGVSLSWAPSTDNLAVTGYDVVRDGSLIAQTSGTSYTDSALRNGTSYSYSVAAYDAAGNVSAQSPTVSATPQASAPPPPPPNHFGTVKSGQGAIPAGYPQVDSVCASEVRSATENRPSNTTANNTMPPDNGADVKWGTDAQDFALFGAEQAYVTGHYTGTTDQILQWGACKWGIDEDLLRAVAADESWWTQSTIGDQSHCGATPNGSWGILQVQDSCNNNNVLGGYPDTVQSTAVNVDYTAMHDRACLDGAFQGYLYDGMTISQDIAAHESYSDPVPIIGDHGEDYVLWGCIGQWYSGDWWDPGAQNYVSIVQGYFQSKPWLRPGF